MIRNELDPTIDNVYSFTDQATLDMINKWAAEHTNNLIKEVITPDMVTPQTVMIFANALYFKGMWDKHFDKRLTHKANFYTADQRTVSVDMMSMSESLLYASADDAQMLELDYKEGKYCMDILLPNNDIPMSDFLAELTADKWQNYISALKEMSELQVYMPKFHFSYKRNLNNDLQQIGIINAFDKDNADFSKLSPLPTYLSFLYQYCYVAVDEESTEAAAVTIGGMEANSIPDNLFRADHPFIFVIREKQYGTILFTGIVGNPTEE